MMRLKDKVAVITGGNSGIGLAIAREFKAQGSEVAIFGRDAATLESAAGMVGNGTLIVNGDVKNLADIDRLYATVKQRFGRVDIVVANAGMTGNLTPVKDVDEALFDEVTDVNFKGLYFTVQKALPYLGEGASIVLISSVLNSKGFPAFSVYSGAKAAVRSLARSFAAEFIGKGIRVNALSPGPVETPIYGKMGLAAKDAQELGESITEMNSMKRFGRPEEVAKAALFLASDDSSYVVGVELVVDGGFTQL